MKDSAADDIPPVCVWSFKWRAMLFPFQVIPVHKHDLKVPTKGSLKGLLCFAIRAVAFRDCYYLWLRHFPSGVKDRFEKWKEPWSPLATAQAHGTREERGSATANGPVFVYKHFFCFRDEEDDSVFNGKAHFWQMRNKDLRMPYSIFPSLFTLFIFHLELTALIINFRLLKNNNNVAILIWKKWEKVYEHYCISSKALRR